MNWFVAFAFCIWDGGRLPTKAEWEKAAAGGVQNRLSPRGSKKPDKTRANYDELYDLSETGGLPFENIAKVAMLPAGHGRWGHKDLAGNMFEWVLDRYDYDWYREEGKKSVDCAYLSEIMDYVIRGGSYNFGASTLRAAARLMPVYPDFRGNFTGFRCARDH